MQRLVRRLRCPHRTPTSKPNLGRRRQKHDPPQVVVGLERSRLLVAFEDRAALGRLRNRERHLADTDHERALGDRERGDGLADQPPHEFVALVGDPGAGPVVRVPKTVFNDPAVGLDPGRRAPDGDHQPLASQPKAEEAGAAHSVGADVQADLIDRPADDQLRRDGGWLEVGQLARRAERGHFAGERSRQVGYLVLVLQAAHGVLCHRRRTINRRNFSA